MKGTLVLPVLLNARIWGPDQSSCHIANRTVRVNLQITDAIVRRIIVIPINRSRNIVSCPTRHGVPIHHMHWYIQIVMAPQVNWLNATRDGDYRIIRDLPVYPIVTLP